MAWRNLWRNPRRTVVTVAAMTLGLLTMILYAAMMEGFMRGMERAILDLELGDVQVFAGDYRDNPSLYTRIEQPDALLAPLERAGFPASARLLAYGMAATDETSAAVSFRGVDIERDARVSKIHEQIAAGSWLDPADPRGVVVGRRLARMLDVGTGSELIVLTQGADGSLAYDLYHVRGVLLGVSDATDRTAIFMTVDAYRELLVVPSGVHQIIVRRSADVGLAVTAATVSNLAEGLDVQTWRQLMPTLASHLDSARGIMVVLYVIIYLAVGILILNAMLMAVFERIREFGVLKALGAGPFEVLGLVLVESAIQTGIASALGLALSVPSLIYLRDVGLNMASMAGVSIMGIATDPVWRAAVTPAAFTGPLATMLIIVSLAVVYPAMKAAWINPLQAMRYR
jgi:ABC-type lipoprotein release transport system permease subunit